MFYIYICVILIVVKFFTQNAIILFTNRLLRTRGFISFLTLFGTWTNGVEIVNQFLDNGRL